MTATPYTLRHLYHHACQVLKPVYGDRAAFEARFVVQRAAHVSPEAFVLDMDQPLQENIFSTCEAMLQRRLDHEPLSRIVQLREFWGHTFKVTPATLDPRADSETLIEAVLETMPDRIYPYRFMDLGTGTGCLLITLLLEYPNACGWAVDRSVHALDVATYNAQTLGVEARFKAMHGSWDDHEFLWALGMTYDTIISNPPYIPKDQIQTLDPAVRVYDPLEALDGGHDGLDAYRALACCLPQLAHHGTHVFLEIGCDQKQDVLTLFDSDIWKNHQVKQDLADHDRVIFFEKNAPFISDRVQTRSHLSPLR